MEQNRHPRLRTTRFTQGHHAPNLILKIKKIYVEEIRSEGEMKLSVLRTDKSIKARKQHREIKQGAKA